MFSFVNRRMVVIGAAAALAANMALGTSATFAQTEPVPLGPDTGPLAAGTYVDTSTGPSVVFTVGDDWEVSGEPLPGVGTELAPVGLGGIVTLTTFDGRLFTAPCAVKGRLDKLLKKTKTVDASAASFVEAMATHGNLVAQELVETELGGLPALQLDVVGRTGKKCEPRWAFLWKLPIVNDFHLSHGGIARIIAADAGDDVVIAFIETSGQSDASPFAFLDKAMELVDTIEITPAEVGPDGATDGDAGGDADPEASEDSKFSVLLTDVGPNAVPVIKLVREVTGLGLKDSKDLVDTAPGAILDGLDRAEAERILAAFKEQGASAAIQ